MITITKEETNEIRERFPDVHIVRTVKGRSRRHKYYCTEDKRVMNFLGRYRGNRYQEESDGERHRYKKERQRN